MKDGGPVFEVRTLRDYFAAAALGKMNMTTWNWDATHAKQDAYKHVAEVAYKVADAMLSERDK